jgi:hypothetical protein
LPAGERRRSARENTPEAVARKLREFRARGLLSDYPLGCDFTPVEQRLAKALGWLKSATATRGGKLRTLLRALAGRARRTRRHGAHAAASPARLRRTTAGAPAAPGAAAKNRVLSRRAGRARRRPRRRR